MGTALSHGRVSDLRDGNYDAVLERYELSFPELFSDDPEVNSVTYRPAIDVAGILLLAGEYERAADLLDKCQKQIAETIRVGFHGFWVSDVQILALQGKTEGALAALRQAIDQSWRTDWRYFFYVDPNLDSIRGKPEFQAILRDIKDDMAAQLQLAREMDANGELVAIPPAR
jgi:tetratricopeptide (TPR) repeat protein